MSIWIAENERNQRHAAMFTDILKEVYGADNVGIGHHLMFSVSGKPDEQPSIDTLIFDHDVAHKLWGSNMDYVLTQLALTPQSARDEMLSNFYYGRTHEVQD